ncbi:MAG: cell division protein ZapA [Candidatus Omnitrophica bacterium]|nr:cell division protein ZapA [Candidatus Omnitrophota bacterium]
MYKINILGKTYSIHSSLPLPELNKVVKEINEKYKTFQNEYKFFDKVDILIFYIIELYELIYNLKKELSLKEEYKTTVIKKIEDVEKELNVMLEKLDKI